METLLPPTPGVTKHDPIYKMAWNLVNDRWGPACLFLTDVSQRSDLTCSIVVRSMSTTLCLQFPPEKITHALLYTANEAFKSQYGAGAGIERLLPRDEDEPVSFFKYFNISPEDINSEWHACTKLR